MFNKKRYEKKYTSSRNLKKVFNRSFLNRLKICFSLFSIVFFILFFFILKYNLFLFLSLLPIVVLTYAYLTFNFLRFLDKNSLLIKKLFFDLKLEDRNDFEKLPVPVMVCDDQGIILWMNNVFKSRVKTSKKYMGENFENFFKTSLQSLLERDFSQLTIDGKEYKIYVSYMENTSIYLIYFEDVSEIEYLKNEYKISKPCVFYIMVDNYKEVLVNKKDSEKSVLMGKVDNVIEKFVDDYMGFMQKYSENEFVIILEARHLKTICNGKFKILKSVREIMEDESFGLTLSIGVGAHANSLNECARFALEALDMSLGRGGDQAAVKTPNHFEFYGGNSKGVEKNTRVRARVIAKSLVKLIADSSNVIVMGHKFADLDSVGSSLALVSTVRRMNKKSYMIVNEGQNLSSVLLDKIKKSGYDEVIVNEEEAISLLEFNSLLVIVDTHNPKFLESQEIYDNCKNVVVIDHHRKMVDSIKDAVIFYHEPYASSTSELVCELIQYFGDEYKLKPIEAEGLLAGIMLDTKNFSVKVGVRTFEAAVYLRRLGADTLVVRKFFASSLEIYKKKAQIVVDAQMYKNCAISTTELSIKETRIICPQAADELLKIEGVQASFVIYKSENIVNITARSLGNFNVQVIMEYLGGGGHQLQAACQIKDISISDAKNKLIECIDRWLS